MMQYPKSRDEWLALRRKYISSTESAALFGMSPYTTAFELAATKQRPELDTFEGNERTEWGKAMQLAAAKKIAEDYGVKCRAINGYAIDEDARMGASFDYEIIGPSDAVSVKDDVLRRMYTEHGKGVLEIKTVDSFVYKNDWPENEPPAHIEIQVQHQLGCIVYGWACIGVLIGGNRAEIVVRERDPEVGQAIAFKSLEFWNLVDAGKSPPVTLPEDADIISKIYGYAEPGKVYTPTGDDDPVIKLVAEYVEIGKLVSAGEKQTKALKAELLLAIKDAERVIIPGYNVSTGTVAETIVPAHVREGYRNVRITAKKETKK